MARTRAMTRTGTRGGPDVHDLEAATRCGNNRLCLEEHGKPISTCKEFDEHRCGAPNRKGDNNHDSHRWRMARTRREHQKKKNEEKVSAYDDLLTPACRTLIVDKLLKFLKQARIKTRMIFGVNITSSERDIARKIRTLNVLSGVRPVIECCVLSVKHDPMRKDQRMKCSVCKRKTSNFCWKCHRYLRNEPLLNGVHRP